MPASLLRSPDHAGLAVAAWAVYETLMPRKLGGGRAAAHARRCWVADALGVSEKTLDGARRSLLADEPDEPWLARSAPLGAKRAVRHAALRLPRDTGEAHAAVPAWTLELLSSTCDPKRRISPTAWRLYGLILLDRPGGADHPLETSVGHLGELLGASPDTGRRHGRHVRQKGRKGLASPTQPRALTPRKREHSPLADPGTPQKTPELYPPELETPQPPAVGNVQVDSPLEAAADAGGPTPTKAPRATREARLRGVRVAAQVYRTAIPPALGKLLPEHGTRRVLAAITAELAVRTPAELANRIDARWQHWRYRTEDITDPVAVAIAITRCGYHCSDLRCEDHVRLDTGQPCQACAAIGAQITRARLTAVQATDPALSDSTVLTNRPADGLDPVQPPSRLSTADRTVAEATTPACPHGDPNPARCALCRHGITLKESQDGRLRGGQDRPGRPSERVHIPTPAHTTPVWPTAGHRDGGRPGRDGDVQLCMAMMAWIRK
ncbi:hypothetical protein [Acrocarpospora sp. B8E8]|uniref:hypothetical protein n=1 Tax=Acrocarpospora sp. B8E8 TaxID=3153572 RepID=UPI00325F542F